MRALIRFIVVASVVAVSYAGSLGARAREPAAGRVTSPAGWCVASLMEAPGAEHTTVLLEFDGGRCGAGAVYFDGGRHGIELRWRDAQTLEVLHPEGVRAHRNASGEVLQCFNRKVRVVLVSRPPEGKKEAGPPAQPGR